MKRKRLQLLVKKYLTFLLLVNFINLSANFYISSSQGSIFSPSPFTDDPMDTVAELVFEYAMDMPDDTIPDTEAPSSDNNQSQKDLKIYFLPISFKLFWKNVFRNQKEYRDIHFFLKNTSLDIPYPPPQEG